MSVPPNHAGQGSVRQTRFVFVNRYFHPDQSATSQILTDLTRGLTTRGVATHVVCCRQLYDDPGARLSRREVVSAVQVHRVITTHFGRTRLFGRALDYLSFYAASFFCLLRVLRRGDVVIAKTDPPLISLVAAMAAWLTGAKLVNWQQDVFPEVASRLGANPLPQWLDGVLRRVRDASLRAAHMNVVVGGRMLEHFAARGIARAKLRVIENWADAESIIPKDPSQSALRREVAGAHEFVLCYSGNLGRAHEYHSLLLVGEALRADPTIIFLFIGGGAKMAALRSEVQKRQLSNFRFLPYQPRETLADSLAAADVHLVSLIPSLEGLVVPSKFYGILAAGRPMVFVGDADGELARIIDAAGCGVTVGSGDTLGFVAAIDMLKRDHGRRAVMGRAARRLLSEHYCARRGIESWMLVFAAISALDTDQPSVERER